MKRREFITLLGSAIAAWPFSPRAQQPGIPVIGFLGQPTADAYVSRVAVYRQALTESGFRVDAPGANFGAKGSFVTAITSQALTMR